MMKRCIWVSLIFFAVLPACWNRQAQTPTCEQLIMLQSQVLQQVSSSELLNWVIEAYHFDPSEVQVLRVGSLVSLTWRVGGYRYSAGAQLPEDIVTEVRVALEERKGGITALAITECFGEPELYAATFQEGFAGNDRYHTLELQMLFPDQGLYVRGARLYHVLPRVRVPLGESFEMDFICVAQPGGAVNILQQRFSMHETVVDEVLGLLKPWPGEWDAIKIDAAPELQHLLPSQ